MVLSIALSTKQVVLCEGRSWGLLNTPRTAFVNRMPEHQVLRKCGLGYSAPRPDEVRYPQLCSRLQMGKRRQSDLPMVPTDVKFSVAVATPPSAFTQRLIVLWSLCQNP